MIVPLQTIAFRTYWTGDNDLTNFLSANFQKTQEPEYNSQYCASKCSIMAPNHGLRLPRTRKVRRKLCLIYIATGLANGQTCPNWSSAFDRVTDGSVLTALRAIQRAGWKNQIDASGGAQSALQVGQATLTELNQRLVNDQAAIKGLSAGAAPRPAPADCSDHTALGAARCDYYQTEQQVLAMQGTLEITQCYAMRPSATKDRLADVPSISTASLAPTRQGVGPRGESPVEIQPGKEVLNQIQGSNPFKGDRLTSSSAISENPSKWTDPFSSGIKQTEAGRSARSVKFENQQPIIINIEIRDGATGASSCDTNDYILERRLAPQQSVVVTCGERIGFCYRWKDSTEERYGNWMGRTCVGNNGKAGPWDNPLNQVTVAP